MKNTDLQANHAPPSEYVSKGNKPIVVAFLITPGGLTGAPRRLLTLAEALRLKEVALCIASPRESALLQAARKLNIATTEIEPAGVLGLRDRALFGSGVFFRARVLIDLVRQNFRAWRCLRREKGDVAWIRGSKGIAFGAIGALVSRRPLIWDVDYELPSSGIVRWMHLLGLWAASAIVFQYKTAPDSIFGRELATRYRHKFQALLPGIEMPALKEFSLRRGVTTCSPDSTFVMLQVGTICDRKNQRLTIAALSEACQRGLGESWELWLAYDEIQDPEFELLLNESGLGKHVRMLGWRDDVKELMVQANLLLMPSKDEGVPNAVQEAMAIGLPVLVSAAGGMPEIVQDGQTGWVLGTNDSTAWADRISWCQANPDDCREIGFEASKFAFKHFDLRKWGESYAGIVRALVSSTDLTDP